ncbi:MAG: hypothetical protein HRT98_02430 [Mycoplasmatales bacterium]|nr:hypothetical protein [Mycoplasmatales bacterium]
MKNNNKENIFYKDTIDKITNLTNEYIEDFNSKGKKNNNEEGIKKNPSKIILIDGEFGSGKTMMMNHIKNGLKEQVKEIELGFNNEIHINNIFYKSFFSNSSKNTHNFMGRYYWRKFWMIFVGFMAPLLVTFTSFIISRFAFRGSDYISTNICEFAVYSSLLFLFLVIFTLGIIYIKKTHTLIKEKIVFIENLDRLHWDNIENILSQISQLDKKVILITLSFANLSKRYEEKYSLKPQNIIFMLEKYYDDKFDLHNYERETLKLFLKEFQYRGNNKDQAEVTGMRVEGGEIQIHKIINEDSLSNLPLLNFRLLRKNLEEFQSMLPQEMDENPLLFIFFKEILEIKFNLMLLNTFSREAIDELKIALETTYSIEQNKQIFRWYQKKEYQVSKKKLEGLQDVERETIPKWILDNNLDPLFIKIYYMIYSFFNMDSSKESNGKTLYNKWFSWDDLFVGNDIFIKKVSKIIIELLNKNYVFENNLNAYKILLTDLKQIKDSLLNNGKEFNKMRSISKFQKNKSNSFVIIDINNKNHSSRFVEINKIFDLIETMVVNYKLKKIIGNLTEYQNLKKITDGSKSAWEWVYDIKLNLEILRAVDRKFFDELKLGNLYESSHPYKWYQRFQQQDDQNEHWHYNIEEQESCWKCNEEYYEVEDTPDEIIAAGLEDEYSDLLYELKHLFNKQYYHGFSMGFPELRGHLWMENWNKINQKINWIDKQETSNIFEKKFIFSKIDKFNDGINALNQIIENIEQDCEYFRNKQLDQMNTQNNIIKNLFLIFPEVQVCDHPKHMSENVGVPVISRKIQGKIMEHIFKSNNSKLMYEVYKHNFPLNYNGIDFIIKMIGDFGVLKNKRKQKYIFNVIEEILGISPNIATLSDEIKKIENLLCIQEKLVSSGENIEDEYTYIENSKRIGDLKIIQKCLKMLSQPIEEALITQEKHNENYQKITKQKKIFIKKLKIISIKQSYYPKTMKK